MVDHLEEDTAVVHGQRFALISFMGPCARQKSEHWGLKIRGVFATKEEAQAHVKKLQREDKMFDIYMVECFKWLAWPPPPIEQIDDVQYQDAFLNEMMQSYKENQELAKEEFHRRKEEVKKHGLPHPPEASEASEGPKSLSEYVGEDTHPSTSGASSSSSSSSKKD